MEIQIFFKYFVKTISKRPRLKTAAERKVVKELTDDKLTVHQRTPDQQPHT
jgi:hypothetical protein